MIVALRQYTLLLLDGCLCILQEIIPTFPVRPYWGIPSKTDSEGM